MTQASTINVVVASDDNYVQHLAVTLLSLVENSSAEHALSLYVLDAGISPENRTHLYSLFQRDGVDFTIISPELKDVGDIPLKRYGHAALLRISIPELLPQTVTRCIYLDCDIVVQEDIAPIATIDLEGHPIAAVENLGHQPAVRLGIEPGDYFNSGVLVMDLTAWRERHIGEQVLSYMLENSAQLQFPDQDGLNAVLHSDWKRLPLLWNQQPATYSMLRKLKPGTQRYENFHQAAAKPAVVHFLARNKPWHYMTFHPLKECYWHYLRKTPWGDYNYPDRSLANRLRKWMQLEKQLKNWRRKHV
jgi:lipopolysaccharide biosynthesis glycosyltransferase